MLCQALIWLSESSNTYCMYEQGHSGEHGFYTATVPPPVVTQDEIPFTPIPDDNNYGPYKHDDPRAHRGF